MPLPVKLSDALVLDARLAAEVEQRSITGQVEYWASLGKLVDALLDGRNRTEALQKSKAKPLSELLATVGTPEGDARLKAYLESEPFPHFEPHPSRKGILIRIEADGTRSLGRFVDRKFVVESHGKAKLLPHLGNAHVMNADGMRLLTKREEDVVRLLAEGMQIRDIANVLKLSEHTIRNYLFHIFDKLGVPSHIELAMYGQQVAPGAPPRQFQRKGRGAVGTRTK